MIYCLTMDKIQNTLVPMQKMIYTNF